jgi:hypothetical protein
MAGFGLEAVRVLHTRAVLRCDQLNQQCELYRHKSETSNYLAVSTWLAIFLIRRRPEHTLRLLPSSWTRSLVVGAAGVFSWLNIAF